MRDFESCHEQRQNHATQGNPTCYCAGLELAFADHVSDHFSGRARCRGERLFSAQACKRAELFIVAECLSRGMPVEIATPELLC